MRFHFSALRTPAGAASAIVPAAIAVHLIAEGLALGAIGPAFWLRHAYLLVPLGLALWSFSSTVGLGRPRREMVRRCALIRAQLHAGGPAPAIVTLAVANLVFFGVTQALEGDPIASGSLVVGLSAAAIGSLAAAIAVFVAGRSLGPTAVAAFSLQSRHPGSTATPRRPSLDVPRTAASSFSLFIPNRPPPLLLPIVR
jgi:hypothetical protein